MREKPLILVVDDEENFREIISAKLQAAGFDVATGTNSKEAVLLADKLQPDVILMDINMPPGATGTDAALAIKQNPRTKKIKIAFLTSLKNPWPGFVAGDNKSVSEELGMIDFLEKDKDLNVLVDKVKSYIHEPPQSSPA